MREMRIEFIFFRGFMRTFVSSKWERGRGIVWLCWGQFWWTVVGLYSKLLTKALLSLNNELGMDDDVLGKISWEIFGQGVVEITD